MDTWAALGICRFRDGSGMYGPEPQIADAPGPAGNGPAIGYPIAVYARMRGESAVSGENKIVTAISIRIDNRLWNWPD